MATVKTQGGKVILKNGKVSCTCCSTPFGLLARATSQDLDLGCAMGPVIKEYIIPPPYLLTKNTNYQFRVEFNSGDGRFHVGSFYQIDLSFSPDEIDINWSTSYGGILGGDPWSITNNGRSIRYSLEDSENCGGSNPNTQTGTAIATIQIGDVNSIMGLDFEGIAELQDTGFENISFYLDPA
jgi:hypothetical protein